MYVYIYICTDIVYIYRYSCRYRYRWVWMNGCFLNWGPFKRVYIHRAPLKGFWVDIRQVLAAESSKNHMAVSMNWGSISWMSLPGELSHFGVYFGAPSVWIVFQELGAQSIQIGVTNTPQYTMILIIGTLKWGPLVFGNPHVQLSRALRSPIDVFELS